MIHLVGIGLDEIEDWKVMGVLLGGRVEPGSNRIFKKGRKCTIVWS